MAQPIQGPELDFIRFAMPFITSGETREQHELCIELAVRGWNNGFVSRLDALVLSNQLLDEITYMLEEARVVEAGPLDRSSSSPRPRGVTTPTRTSG